MIQIKRVYEPAEKTDGYRIFVDRLWPRGLKKEELLMDEWIKDLAPSAELRKWFNHEPEKWETFSARYLTELQHNEAIKKLLLEIKKQKKVTLLYAARDEKHNHALVLQHYLNKTLQ